jgi:hypothetical protein
MLRNQNGNCEECGGARRYTVSAVLLVLLLGLLPAACSDPEGAAVSQGTPRSSTEGSDPTEEQPRGDDMSEPDGEPSVQGDEPQGGGSGTRQVPPPSSGQ